MVEVVAEIVVGGSLGCFYVLGHLSQYGVTGADCAPTFDVSFCFNQ